MMFITREGRALVASFITRIPTFEHLYSGLRDSKTINLIIQFFILIQELRSQTPMSLLLITTLDGMPSFYHLKEALSKRIQCKTLWMEKLLLGTQLKASGNENIQINLYHSQNLTNGLQFLMIG
jgi:hypothetical protein